MTHTVLFIGGPKAGQTGEVPSVLLNYFVVKELETPAPDLTFKRETVEIKRKRFIYKAVHWQFGDADYLIMIPSDWTEARAFKELLVGYIAGKKALAYNQADSDDEHGARGVDA